MRMSSLTTNSLFGHLGGMMTLLLRPLMTSLWFPALYASVGMIGISLVLWEWMDRTQDEMWKVTKGMEKFDFIVVGAGSSGSLVANRLSAHFNVLLLEAGGEPNPMQFIPGFGFFLINFPQTDWMFKTVPQTGSCGNSVNQRASWSAGKGLGGTGNLNLMVHLRGHYKDYDNWGNLTKSPDWSWDGVLPYFKKYEDYEDAFDVDKRYHGFSGDLRIQTSDYLGLGVDFIKAGIEMGYPLVDLNGKFDQGFGIVRYPVKNGVRQASYKAFLEPLRGRNSLTIRKFAHVNRVLFRTEDRDNSHRAYGVEYDRHGERHVAFASKEVLLTAGTVNTAKILMLSGIGPKEHLEQIGIPLLKDLPVGHNLQDHVAVYLNPFFISQPRSFLMDRDLLPSAYLDYFSKGSGILSSPGVQASALLSSSLSNSSGSDWPDIQLFISSVGVSSKYSAQLSKAFGLKEDEMQKYYAHAVGKDSFTLIVSGARPLSRGRITLGGSSPLDQPLIDPAYFSDPEGRDLKVIIEGIRKALFLVENSTAFGSNLGARFTEERLPGCEDKAFRSDEYFECYIRRYTVTLHHFCGSAKMGEATSGATKGSGVVDPLLRVVGTKGLRVLDLSVMPEIVTTNTQAAALMIGEKGADLVLREWLGNTDKDSTISDSINGHNSNAL